MHWLLLNCCRCFHLMGLPGIQGQVNEFPLPPLLNPLCTTRGVGYLTAVLWPPPLPHIDHRTECCCNFSFLFHGSSMGQFFFSVSEKTLPPIFICWHYYVYFLISGSYVVTVHTNGGSTVWVCTATLLEDIHGRYMCLLMFVLVPYQEHCSHIPLCFELGMPHATLTAVHTFYAVRWSIQLWGLGIVTWSLSLPYLEGIDLLFQVCYYPGTWLILNLWWKLNLVILV